MASDTLRDLRIRLAKEEHLEREIQARIPSVSPDMAVSLRWSAASHRERATDLRIMIARLQMAAGRALVNKPCTNQQLLAYEGGD